MFEYFTRLKTSTGTTAHRFRARDFSDACRVARKLAREVGGAATATNLVGKFRLREGERVVEHPEMAVVAVDSGSGHVGFEPLDECARLEVCRLTLRGLYLTENPGLRRLGHFVIDRTLWFWTADALIGGEYVRDAVKRNLNALPHTPAAARARSVSQLRHEHAVPRKVVRQYLLQLHPRWSAIAEAEAVSEIASVLDLCPPVLVTIEEERKLAGRLRAGMGGGAWSLDDPFVRYRLAGIVDCDGDLRFPTNCLWTSEGRYRSTALAIIGK